MRSEATTYFVVLVGGDFCGRRCQRRSTRSNIRGSNSAAHTPCVRLVSNIGTKFALNYGGGVKLMPAGPVGLRGDVRGYTLTGVQGHKLNAVEVSLGVVFRF